MPASTVGKVLRCLGLGRLRALEPKPPPMRYERERPGELIHLDSKKLGRIEGIGHRITGRRPGAINRHHGIGWEALHICIDDASRLAYSEILADEKKESAIGFLGRALAWPAGQGITVERVMTDCIASARRARGFRRRRARGAPMRGRDAMAATASALLSEQHRKLTRRPWLKSTGGKPYTVAHRATVETDVPTLAELHGGKQAVARACRSGVKSVAGDAIDLSAAKLPAATGTRGQMRGRDVSGVARRATPESDAPTLAELHGRADRGSRLQKRGVVAPAPLPQCSDWR
jgi:hypothetical protein